MMINEIYETVQAKLNKEQIGYLRPLYYNMFLKTSLRTVYNRYFSEIKTNVRKKNWWLDGKDFANYSEHIRQLLEYYSFEANIDPNPVDSGNYVFPDDMEFVEDVFVGTTRIDKVKYSDFLDLQTNIYAAPSACSPICSKVGDKLKVAPTTTSTINLHYLRKPKTPKWTYEEVNGKHMFNEDANDFQDVDIHESAYDQLVSLVFEHASIYLRDFNATQTANAEQSQEAQLENKE